MLLQTQRILTEQQERLPNKWRKKIDVFIMLPTGKILVGYHPLFKTLLAPGGGVDEGQNLRTAAYNECLEELGVRIKNWKLIPGAVFDFDWHKYLPADAQQQPKMQERMKIFRGIKIYFSRAEFDEWDYSVHGRDKDIMRPVEATKAELIKEFRKDPLPGLTDYKIKVLRNL